ncbi:prohibitin family protein [Limibacter armeniacum]|uniref:prohibitin family protein n=1 Tax=Limibacter armeniacum TaxID=466084 RepID=UPI002FE65C58
MNKIQSPGDFSMSKPYRRKLRNIVVGSVLTMVGLLVLNPFVVVDSGFVGVKTNFGAVQNEILPEGMHMVVPFRTKVIPINVRVQKVEADAAASSKDLQNVTSRVALNYFLSKDKANTVFQELGKDYQQTIIEPTIQESIKSVTAMFTAEELITKRPDVKEAVYKVIKKRLEINNIMVTDFSIIDFNFSEEFNRAIEAKQIAEQRALTAKNDLNRIKTEAEQVKAKAEGEANAKLAMAKAEAEAQRMLSQSITEKVLKLRSIEKWDGVMPVSIGEGTGAYLDMVGMINSKSKK